MKVKVPVLIKDPEVSRYKDLPLVEDFVVEQEELQVGELLVLAVPMSVRDGVVVHELVPGGAELVATPK